MCMDNLVLLLTEQFIWLHVFGDHHLCSIFRRRIRFQTDFSQRHQALHFRRGLSQVQEFVL